MNAPQYLTLFSHQGSITVEVKTQGGEKLDIRKMAMDANDLELLVSHSTGNFIDEMYIDDVLFSILKFEIVPKENRLTIWVAN